VFLNVCALQDKTNAFIISIFRIPAKRQAYQHIHTLKLHSLAILIDRFGKVSGGIIEVKCRKECREIMSCDFCANHQ